MQQTAYQPATGFERSISVKDIGGNAANFNIVVAPFGQQTIDNVQTSIVISEARANVRLIPLIDLTGWAVETNSGGGGGGGGGDVFKAGNNTFTGINTFQNTITAPTVTLSDNSINVATTAFVKGQNYITGAALAPYALIASPVFTGDPQAPTPSPGDNDTSIATTAFVQAALAGFTGGAPINAEYIVGSLNGTLTNERVLTDTATVTWDLSTAGQAKANAVSGSAVAKVGFSAHKNGANQSIPAATQTKVTFDTEIYDIGSFYDPTLARWTPPAGLVHIDAGMVIAGAATGFVSVCSVYKNGAVIKSGSLAPAPDGSVGTQVSIDDQATGTDFYEVFASVPPTSTATITGAAQATFFMGHLLGGPQGPPGPSGGVPEAPSDGSIYGRQNAAWAKSQPLDGDLTAIAALAGTNTIYYRSAVDTWSPVTFSGLSFSGGVLTVTAGGGNVNNSGTPTVGQVAVWTNATTIQGTNTLNDIVLTGDPKAPTPATADNDTSVATTAFVKAAIAAGGSSSITISDTPPSSPAAGNLWWESDTGTLWIYYTDANSSQWVVAAAGGVQPVQPGTRVLIQRQDVSAAVPTVTFTTGIDSTYDEYELHFFNAQVSVLATIGMMLQVSLDGGTTWKSDANYQYALRFNASVSGQSGNFETSAATYLQLTVALSGNSSFPADGIIRFARPSSSGICKYFRFENSGHNNTTSVYSITGAGCYIASTAPVNGIRIGLTGAGNYTSGSFILYGVKK
jgi:hypothetical protein